MSGTARWYVAALPDTPGILRCKDAAGIAEWHARRWEFFSRRRTPQIHDVTGSVPAIWRAILDRAPLYNAPRTLRGFLRGAGLAFGWAGRELLLYDELTPPADVSDLTAKALPDDLLGPFAGPGWALMWRAGIDPLLHR